MDLDLARYIVEHEIMGEGEGTFVKVSGDTMSGKLTITASTESLETYGDIKLKSGKKLILNG